VNNIIVSKFGGSSLADSTQFGKVKKIIQSDKRRKYIVPSAPGKRFGTDYKITDLLYLCHGHAEQGIPFDDVYKVISNRYMDLAKDLEIIQKLDIETYLIAIKEKIASGASSDYTASRGEFLNGLILSAYLDYEFIDATELIYFNRSGNLDTEKTQGVIHERLSRTEKAVIPGFYGSLPNGNIKTFSRGGSDITGAIIARGAYADLYENWTDVSGFLMADPKIVNNPKHIDKITYRELRELSYMGATVLHEDSIFPVKRSGIPIHIKNTNRPQDEGTVILSDFEALNNTGTITGIAGRKDFTVIAIEKTLVNAELGFGRKLLSILESNGVSLENMPSGIDAISLVIADTQLENKLDNIIDEIEKQCNPDSIEVYPNMALVATVGRGMMKTKGIAAKIFHALEQKNVNIRMINQGSSEINIIIGVETDDFEKAVIAIYEAFENPVEAK